MKRLICAITALFLCLAFSQTAFSAGDKSIVVINDEIRYADRSLAPITEDGAAYIPESLLFSLVDATAIYDEPTSYYTIFAGGKILSFNLDSGIMITNDNRFLSARAIIRDSRFYLPAAAVCSELGLIFSPIAENIYRIKKPPYSLDDSDVSRILRATPTDEALRGRGSEYYFAVFGFSGFTTTQLHRFEDAGMRAIFFLSDDDILSNPLLVCEIYAAGFDLGVTLSGKFASSPHTADEVAAEFDRVNHLLERLLRIRTVHAGLPAGSPYNTASSEKAAGLLGYKLWVPNIGFPDSAYVSSSSSAVISMAAAVIPYTDYPCLVHIQNSVGATASITALKGLITVSGAGISDIRILTFPVNYRLTAYTYNK